MKRRYLIPIFVFVQLFLIAILTLWIVWYAHSRATFLELFQKYGIDPSYQTHVVWLLQGIFLVIPVIIGASFIFFAWAKSKSLDIMRINFISSITHELLTPLSSIKLYLETLMLHDISPEQKQSFLLSMQEDVERLSTLITQILTASRIERSKGTYHFEAADLSEFINQFIEENKLLIKSAIINTNLEENSLCNFDPESFRTLLKNLIENAIRYSVTNTHISITLKRINEKLLLRVSDNGMGIEKKHLKKVFKMFYRTTKMKRGTGLGLYIVKNIVKAHKGKI